MTRFLPGVVNKIVWHNVDSEVSLRVDQHSLDPTTDTIIKKESKASERPKVEPMPQTRGQCTAQCRIVSKLELQSRAEP